MHTLSQQKQLDTQQERIKHLEVLLQQRVNYIKNNLRRFCIICDQIKDPYDLFFMTNICWMLVFFFHVNRLFCVSTYCETNTLFGYLVLHMYIFFIITTMYGVFIVSKKSYAIFISILKTGFEMKIFFILFQLGSYSNKNI